MEDKDTKRPLPPLRSKRRIRILLAEDDPITQKVTLKILKKFGYRARAVENGMEAIKALESVPYDLVLMDVQMPEMGAFKTTRQIRGMGTGQMNRHIPIIAMTAHAMKGDRERCLNSGMDDYVSKPIDPDELGEVIARWTPLKKRNDQKSCKQAKGFNPDSLLELLGGDRKIYDEVMTVFLQDVPKQIRILEDAIKQSDASIVQRQAHTLKGASAIVGATGLEEVAHHLGGDSKRQDLSQAFEMLDRIKTEFNRFEEMLADEQRRRA